MAPVTTTGEEVSEQSFRNEGKKKVRRRKRHIVFMTKKRA